MFKKKNKDQFKKKISLKENEIKLFKERKKTRVKSNCHKEIGRITGITGFISPKTLCIVNTIREVIFSHL